MLAEGSRVHYSRTSAGTSYTDAVYGTTAPTAYYGSTIQWTGASAGPWSLTLKDGTVYTFLDGYSTDGSRRSLLSAIKDRYGNTIQFTRDPATQNLTRVTSPNARWLAFTCDSSNRIIQATDNSGRSYAYTYDTGGRLATVTDPMSGVTQYTYDANNQMLTIVDPRGHTYVTNQYDASGRVQQQTMADGGLWQFNYTQDGNGNIIQTDTTNPRGFVRRVAFNTAGYFSGGQVVTETRALGQPEQQAISYQRDPLTGLLASTTDALGRVTVYTYDSKGNTLTVTWAYGTSDAATTSYVYDLTFSRIISVTDPTNHTIHFTVDPATGAITSMTDPLGYQITMTYNTAGQPLTRSDSGNAVRFTITAALLATISDALRHTSPMIFDFIGPAIQKNEPLSANLRFTLD